MHQHLSPSGFSQTLPVNVFSRSSLSPTTNICQRADLLSLTVTHGILPPQDNPVVDDLKATLEYDMTSFLSEPRWMDGLQQFLGVGYETGLSVLVDVRCGHTRWLAASPLGGL
eukprot:1161214-Pelagomonas_calceolata.AAC.12